MKVCPVAIHRAYASVGSTPDPQVLRAWRRTDRLGWDPEVGEDDDDVFLPQMQGQRRTVDAGTHEEDNDDLEEEQGEGNLAEEADEDVC